MHRLALLFWCSLSIYILSPAFALPTGGNNLSIYTNPQHLSGKNSTNHLCEARVHDRQRDDLGASNVKTSARRRWMRLDLANQWHVVYEAFRIFLPAEKVVPMLEAFYLAFQADVTTKWLNTPAVDHLKIRQGMVELEFWNPNGIIPWPLIATLTDILLELTRRGQSGEINAVFFNGVGGNIAVAQRIVTAAAAA